LTTIGSLVSLEWSALAAEARIGDMVAARDAREHRRLFQRLLADFERSILLPVTATNPGRALDEHIAKLRSTAA
jgi:hypothetical protein